ncbi:MAG: DUF2752 domain-containing protein [Ktedonobacterales bacterium]
MQHTAGSAFGRLAAYLLIPCALMFIPTEWLEKHPAPCLYRLVFNRSCPGCGMARALSSVAHGRFLRSFAHNKLVVVVLPLGIVAWLRGVTTAYNDLLRAVNP